MRNFHLFSDLFGKLADIPNKDTDEKKNPKLLIIKYFSQIKLSFWNFFLFPQPKVDHAF